MKLFRVAFVVIFAFSFSGVSSVNAQCSSCTYTYPGGTSPYSGQDLNGNKRACFTSGTYTGSFGNFNGNNNSICIAPGATVNWNKDFNSLTIEVYGTLNFNGGNFNGSTSQINVYSGGVLNTGTSVSQMSNVIVNISSGGTMNINTTNSFTFQNSGGIINAGTVNANTPSNVVFNGNTGLQNSGTFYATKIEIVDGAPTGSGAVLRQNTGSIIVKQYAYIHGYYMNAAGGVFKVTGTGTGSPTGFTNGDVGSNQFINNGTLNVVGPMTINGPMTNNGAIFVNGDVTINKAVTGTNGKLGMSNGTSKINSGGSYSGSNMKICDQSTSNNNFSAGSSSSYSVDCATVYAALPLNILSFGIGGNNANGIYFRWITANEINVDNLQLQGSTDGNHFTAIENVQPLNNSGPNTYTSATVTNSNYSYYRLAAIDKDGKINYSTIVFVKPASTNDVSIYPNPVTNLTFYVKTPTTTHTVVNVFSADGRLLYTTNGKNQLQYKIVLPSAAKSFNYLTVQVISGGKSSSFGVLNQ